MSELRRAVFHVLLGVAALVPLLAGCGPSPSGRPPVRLAALRLVDDPSSAATGDLPWGRYVTIGDEQRLALTSVAMDRAASFPGVRPPVASPLWTVPLPEPWHGVPWILLTALGGIPGGASFVLPGRIFAGSSVGTGIQVVVPQGFFRDERTYLNAVVVGLPPLEKRDIVTAPLVVPAGATLGFGYGIEQMGHTINTSGVEFRVGVVADDREEVVFRGTLDPGRRLEDRTWHEAEADLGPFAGRTVRLRLSNAPADPTKPGTSLPVWGDPTVLAPRPTQHTINVVLVSLDTLRARSVSAYGADRPTTPNLDAFGASGVIFDVAHSTSAYTLPAHMSTFTGLWTRAHGITGHLIALSPTIPTLPEHMRAGGWTTAAFTEDGFVVPATGFRRGFGSYRENTSREFHEPEGHSAKTFQEGLEWVAHHGDEAFFLFLHTYEVHFPYTPRRPYDEAFERIDSHLDLTERALLRYEQEARYLDDQLQKFLDGLDGLGLGARTLVVVMADHGEEFLEHGQRHHGNQLFEEVVHVPLMMRLPGAIPPGQRIALPVSLVDVAPTILDLAGAPALIGSQGKSLARLIDGTKAAPDPAAPAEDRPTVFADPLADRPAIFAETAAGLGPDAGQVISVRTVPYHCVFWLKEGRAQCFDAAKDPYELSPLPVPDPRLALQARIQASSYLSTATIPHASPAVAGRTKTDEEREEKLRALGYVQ